MMVIRMMLWRSIKVRDYVTGLYSTLPFIIYPGVNQAREIQTPAVLVRQFEQHSQNRIRKVDDARLCGPSLPIELTSCSLWVGVGRGPKKPYASGFQSRTLIWGPTPGQAVPGAHEEWAPEAAFGGWPWCGGL
ncbi:hypothetical protein ACOMHN_008047 [Nucella lapillus]